MATADPACMRGKGAWLLWASGALAACRGDGLPSGAAGETEPAEPESVQAPGAAGAPDMAEASPATASSAGAQSPAQANAGAPNDPAACGAELVTLDELHAGRVRAGANVTLPALVASSQKFLVSEAKSGSCLWGAFASDEQKSGARSGVFLVSFGAKHAEGVACTPGGDGIPDDLAPGERIEAQGFVDEYAPSGCQVAPAQQVRVDVACPLRRLGKVAALTPAVIEPALASQLAAGQDARLLRDWGAALVRLEGVSAAQDADDGDAVFPFGVIRLNETKLEVHSRLYYFDLLGGGPKSASKAPGYGFPTEFRSLTGIVFLDYCSWVLAPRDRCSDALPASRGCSPEP